MAKDNKFGTFGGVYTPSILTILGVIMYLRLPWVIGHAGLYAGLGIIAVAHVVSFSTGLSISSIATDKNVGAGGPYYIVSRSLGLPIGGTLGLALFVGLGFSVSLYVIGFSESLLRTFDLEATPNRIRLCGSLTLVVLTLITLVSTALAIKTQYLIFLLIVLSIGSIFLGQAPENVTALQPEPGGESLAKLFAIFFPAVTGFTAGVNMSGDLRDPKSAIPRGTLLAISSGLIVYVGLAIFLAVRIPRDQLLNNPSVLSDFSLSPGLVTAGIWGATLSSALGSILGAPRILQAVSRDRITPAWFSKGYGPTQEPRNALLIAFLIGWSGILIAELDAIARIVSMIFLATYGFLNLSCAIESWASPDFRPAFKIPKSVSVVGAATCLVVMIQLDLPAMVLAVALMAGLYAWLTRRQIRLESGDTWEGFWASMVRTGLHKLARQAQQQRNWRPNILLFRRGEENSALISFAHSLVSGNGLLSDFVLRYSGHRDTPRAAAPARLAPPDAALSKVGVFHHEITTADPVQSILAAARFHGFAGLAPNTVLLDWPDFRGKAELLSTLVSELGTLDYNLLLYASSERSDESIRLASRIDVWWSPEAGNLALNLALVRFITASEQYNHASVRFALVSNDAADNDVLRTRTRRVLSEARVNASVEIFNNALERRPLAEWIADHSSDAALTVFGLARNPEDADGDYFEALEELSTSLHAVVLAGSSSTFAELLRLARVKAEVPGPGPASSEPTQLLSFEVPEPIEANVKALADAYEAIVGSFHEHCVSRLYDSRVQFLRSLETLIERHFQQLRKACVADTLRKRRRAVHRAQAALATDAERVVKDFIANVLPEQEATLDGRIEAFISDDRFLPTAPDRLSEFGAARAAFAPKKGDSRALLRLKWRRRVSAFFWRKEPTYFVPLRKLEVFYRDRMIREVLEPLVRSVTSDSHQLAAHIGKVMDTTELGLAALSSTLEGATLLAQLDSTRAQSLAHIEQLLRHQTNQAAKSRSDALAHAAGCLEDYAGDVGDVGILAKINRDRRPDKDQPELLALLDGIAARWSRSQALLLRRSQAEVQLAAFQQRVAVVVYREKERLAQLGSAGPLAALKAFEAQLVTLRALTTSSEGQLTALRHAAEDLRFERKAAADATGAVERLERECAAAFQSLPEELELPTAETLDALAERGVESIETVRLSVRALCQFLVESQLLGRLSERLQAWPAQEQRALVVAQDVERLITFQINESDLSDTSWEESASVVLPAIDNGIERLRNETKLLEDGLRRSAATFSASLVALVAATRIGELIGASDSLDQKLRLERGRRAVTGVRGRIFALARRAKELGTRALYRLSTGVLLARNLQNSAARAQPSTTLRAFCDGHEPRPLVLEKLAFFYRQLFFGQATLNETFWVGRKKELDQARALTADYQRHGGAALIVHGERGAGKTAFCQRFISGLGERLHVFQVHPVVGGASTLGAFREAVEAAFERRGTLDELFAALPAGSVVLIDDLELWWLRSPNGLAVIDALLRVVEDKKSHCLVVLSLNTEAFHLISRLRPLAESALGVIECGPFDAETLRDIIRLRHGSTGALFSYNGKSEQALSHWALARLFAAHYHYSRGFVGPALQSWVTHIVEAGDPLTVILPRQPELSAFDELKVEHTALLVQLALHKQLHEDRIYQMGGGNARALQQHISTLQRMGLIVSPRPQVFELNRFVQHLLVERFQQRGLLP